MRRTALALALIGALLVAAPAAAAPFVYSSDAANALVRPFDPGPGGALAPLAPQAATGSAPQGVEVSPDGRSVYAVARLGGTISAWDVQPDGTLTAKSPATVASISAEPVDIALTPDGKYAFVAGYADQIDRYAVAADGDLTPLGSTTAAGGLETIAISPDGASLYSTSLYTSSIRLFTIGADGSLTPKSTPSITLSSAPRDIALSPDGTALYTAGTQVHQFRVTAGGLLEARTPATLTGDGAGFGIVVAADGRTVYVLGQDGGSAIAEPYAILPDGTLEALPDARPAGVSSGLRYGAVAPDGDSLYVAAPGASALLQLDRAADGTLTPKTPVSVAAGSPWDVDVRPEADLGVAVASAPSGSGGEATITATATNVRGTPTRATVTVPVPADMTYVAASATAGTCIGTGPVVCAVGSLSEGRSATVTVRAQPTRTGSIPVTASVAGLAPDPVASNASDAGTATVVAQPGATTAPASAIDIDGAVLNGVAVPSGPNTQYRFEYGPTAAYGQTTPAATTTTPGLVTAAISGLDPATTYHFRLVVENESATVDGADQTFTTAATPPPPPEPEVIIRTVTVPGPTITREVVREVPVPTPVPTPPAPQDTAAPKLSKLTLSRTRLGLTVGEAATVRATIEVRRGRRWVKVRTASLKTTKAGAGRVTLTALRPGRYRITVRATDAAGNAAEPLVATKTLRG